MADYDWSSTLTAVKTACPAIEHVAVGQASDGVAYSSYPLAADGNYAFWVYTDAYKAMITKDSGDEVEEDVYETYNLACLLGGFKTDANFMSQGVRINGDKFSVVREMTSEKLEAMVDGVVQPVTVEKLWVCKGRRLGLVIAMKGGYYMCATFKSDPRADPVLAVSAALAVGFYWTVGADA